MEKEQNKKQKFFVKQFANRELYQESLSNSREAFILSKDSNFFTTPEILDFDDNNCRIIFEFYNGSIAVRKLLRSWNYLGLSKEELKMLFYNIGASIAEYHIKSKKLHGDFQPNNVMFTPGITGKTAFVDFSRSELCEDDPEYNRGSIYKDLALFAIHIKIKYPFKIFPLVFRKFNDVLCRMFFSGYFENSDNVYDYDRLSREIDNYRDSFYKNTFVFRFLGRCRFAEIGRYENEHSKKEKIPVIDSE